MSELFLIHPAFNREEEKVVVRHSSVDSAGYRTTAELVASFKQAGVQHMVFQQAEFDGDMEVSPLHRNYIDPVDRDEALQQAIERGKQAKRDYEKARRAALDKRKELREAEIIAVQERLRRLRNVPSKEPASPENLPPPTE